jgi:ABC-2 type transport system permease protein
MLLNMLKFEWRYYVRQPSFYVTCLIFFLLPFFATTSENVRIGGANTIYNGSMAISQTMLIMGIFALFLVVNFIANTATKNDTFKMSELLYTKPINPFSYHVGRFLGAYLIVLVVFAMVPLGVLVGSFIPWVDPERLGETNLTFYVTTFVYFSAPTLFVFSCLFYAVGQKFKSMMSVYLTAVAVFILYIISGNFVNEPEFRTIAAITDPFGVRTFGEISRYWTPIERDTTVLSFEGVLMQNRLLWMAIGVTILGLFGGITKPLTLSAQKSVKQKKSTKLDVAPTHPRINITGTKLGGFEKFKLRTLFEIKQIMTSPAFYLLLLFSAFSIVMALISPGSLYGTSNWPITQSMVREIVGGFGIMTIIIITYYSGEVVWRERSSGMGDIIDSMPVFNINFWLSKLVAVCLTILALYAIGMVTTICYQLIKGVQEIDISQYLISLLFFYALPMFQMVVLAFFFQVLSPNKYVGMLAFLGFFFVSLAFSQLGLEHNLYNYSGSPSLNYSDMNGYGWMLQTQSWYNLYWTALAVVLSSIGYALWQRGPQVKLKHRFKQIGYHLGAKGKWVVASAALVFVFSGSVIYYNTQVLNLYSTPDETMDRQASYEKKYDQYVNIDIPVITKVNARVDIFPSKRSIIAEADIVITNKYNQPIKKFLVNRPLNTESFGVEFPNGKLVVDDEDLGVHWYVFDEPLLPGQNLTGKMSVVRTNEGFKERGFDYQVVENGTFIDNMALFPFFGVSNGYYISDRHERRKRDLPPPKRANKLEDKEYYNQSFFGKGTEFIDFEATVSTAPDQIAISPGYLQKEWQDNGRRYFHYKMDAPMVNFYSFLSARFEVKKAVHKGVNIEVYYHPTHDMNVDVMIESTKDSIDYFTEAFGPYQHKQMRIIEFPGYRSFAQSFANTVPYSENIGFTTDLRDPELIDPVYYVTAHELAHQWWGHQVGAANVQGSAIISETLSQYSAIMVMAKKYGDEKLRAFLKYELDIYLRGRTSEILEEMPLMRAENQSYIHYNKGSVVMMAIKDRLGEARLNQALQSFLQQFKYQSTPFPTTLDLVSALSSVSNDEEQQFIKDQFEDITLYDLKAKSVTVNETDSGQYQVELSIVAKRFTADGKGTETEADLNELIDVVLFSEDPEDLSKSDTVLYNQKHRIKTGDNVITITLDSKPKFAGVDPFVKLVDRDSSDNVIKL